MFSDWLIAAMPHVITHAVILLIIGLITLGVGGHYIVPATVRLGKAVRLSPTIIAVVVLAGGTSAPELIVSLQAALDGSADIALGNVIGSNMANLLLVMGLAACFAPFHLHHRTAIRSSLIMLSFTAITLFSLTVLHAITPAVGWVLLGATTAYVIYLMRMGEVKADEDESYAASTIIPALAVLTAAILALLLGADFIVTGGVILAAEAGFSEATIGLSIIAIGTSLPEIVAVIASVMQKRSDVALGNVLGSNIFNLGMILGLTAVITPLAKTPDLTNLTLGLLGISTVVITCLIIARTSIKKPIAFVFVGFYFAFLGTLV